jgi:hypothetical protein
VLLRNMGSAQSHMKPYLEALPTNTGHPCLWSMAELRMLNG